MSQVFSGDSATYSVGSIGASAEQPVVTGNFVNPPFGNAKAVVFGSAQFLAGTGATSVTVRIRRNPFSENVVVGSAYTVTVVAGNNYALQIQAADVIPDGRSVQYQLTVQQAGASGTGFSTTANVATLLISG